MLKWYKFSHKLYMDNPGTCNDALCACFQSHPCQQLVLFLRDTSAADLTALLQFMYRGSVDVKQAQLGSLIRTAEMLQIRGLSGDEDRVRNGGRGMRMRSGREREV